jgi:hypothetical protein
MAKALTPLPILVQRFQWQQSFLLTPTWGSILASIPSSKAAILMTRLRCFSGGAILGQSQNRAQKLLAYLGDLAVNGSSIKGQVDLYIVWLKYKSKTQTGAKS